MRLPDLVNRSTGVHLNLNYRIGHKIFEIYLYENVVSYLKFRFNLTSYVMSGCAGDVKSEKGTVHTPKGWSVLQMQEWGLT